MRIEHIAIWTRDLEGMRSFFARYFEAQAGNKYVNRDTGFSSYFLTFSGGARLELMHREDLSGPPRRSAKQTLGFTHLAFSLGDRAAVDRLTQRLSKDGYTVLDGPRTTGDGYYESRVIGPEGNQIEITI